MLKNNKWKTIKLDNCIWVPYQFTKTIKYWLETPCQFYEGLLYLSISQWRIKMKIFLLRVETLSTLIICRSSFSFQICSTTLGFILLFSLSLLFFFPNETITIKFVKSRLVMYVCGILNSFRTRHITSREMPVGFGHLRS